MPAAQQAAHEFVGAPHDEGIGQQQEQIGCGQGSGAYQQATAMTFLGMIAGQVGTAFAARTQRASLWSVGLFTNRYLLAGIAAEIVLAGLFVYPPPMQALLGRGVAGCRPPTSAVRGWPHWVAGVERALWGR